MAQTTARLPLSVVLRPCMPVKTATYKITVDTNKSPVNLGDLFSGLFTVLLVTQIKSRIYLHLWKMFKLDIQLACVNLRTGNGG